MATSFGAPMDDVNVVDDQLNTEVGESVDPNDPRLTSEPLDDNPEGNAYARQPLPPDGKYRAKAKLMKVKDSKGHEHNYLPKPHKKSGQLYAFTSIEFTILDATGLFDGVKVYDPWVGTFMGRDKSHKVGTIVRMLKDPAGQPWVKPGERLDHKMWMERLVKVLAGEPEVGISTQWEWSCQECGKEAKAKAEKAGEDAVYPKSILGMHRFPPLKDAKKPGQYDPEMRCQVNPAHGYSRARVKLDQVIPLAEVK